MAVATARRARSRRRGSRCPVPTVIGPDMQRQVEHKGRIMLAGGLPMGACYFAFAITLMFVPTLVLLAFGNTGNMLSWRRTTACPDAVRGRVMALPMMSFGMMPLGVLPVARASDVIGVAAAIAIWSGVMLVVIVAFFASSPLSRGLRLKAIREGALSPVEATRRIAESDLSAEDARRMTGRVEM